MTKSTTKHTRANAQLTQNRKYFWKNDALTLEINQEKTEETNLEETKSQNKTIKIEIISCLSLTLILKTKTALFVSHD